MAYWSELRAEVYLGEGSFGIVFTVSDVKSGEQTALKFINTRPTSNGNNLHEIRREIQIMERIQHPNVVSMITSEIFEGPCEINLNFANSIRSPQNTHGSRDKVIARFHQFYHLSLDNPSAIIQMRLCGRNLREWLNETHVQRLKDKNTNDPKEFSVAFAKQQVDIAQNTIAGLKYLHEIKILHRDIKPDNILFSAGGFYPPVKLSDFGASTEIPSVSQTQLTPSRGAVLYSAEETRTGFYGTKSDWFSLGLVLWEIFQNIPSNELSFTFNRLVEHEFTDIIAPSNRHILNLKDLIIQLTKRKAVSRLAKLKTVDFEFSSEWKTLLEKDPILQIFPS